MKCSNPILYALLLATSVSGYCLHGTSHERRQLQALESAPLVSRAEGVFGYGPLDGPINWHNLSPANRQCAFGKNQSPAFLDGTTQRVAAGGMRLNANTIRSAKLENTGYGVQVNNASGTLNALGRQWTLKQFHFHTPSEHRAGNGEYSPVEMHLVHEANDGSTDLAVLGFLIEISDRRESYFITSALAPVASISTKGATADIGRVDFAEIAEHVRTNSFYQYAGSLTTPPCSEGVSWFVSSEPLYINLRTFNDHKRTVKYNARNIQNAPGKDNVLQIACSSIP